MPQIVRHKETAKRWRLGVERGLAVILDRFEEIDGLLALCRFVPTPQLALSGVYDVLNRGEVDFERWGNHLHDFDDLDRGGDRRGYDPWTTEHFGDRRTATVTLIDALSLARILWQESAREADNLHMVLVLADPRAATVKEPCHVAGEAVGLRLEYGSLASALFKLPLSVPTFAVCLVLGEGVTPAARTAGHVNRLRGAADEATAYPLPRIDQLQPDKVGNRGLVVLVHGLMGTDVGTFGTLEQALVEEQEKRRRSKADSQFLVAGFPHDSVTTSVQNNAKSLATVLRDLGNPRTALVCHSRGGLVARAAAALPKEFGLKPDIIATATFGTPHRGASLAESPSNFALSVLLWRASGQGRAVDLLADLLCAYSIDGKLKGVEDLKPSRGDPVYLDALAGLEAEVPRGEGPQMLRVGGMAKPTGVKKWLVERLLGGKDHDLVVETSSSLPADLRGNLEPLSGVNHFGYFASVRAGGVADAADFVRRWM
jgi:pimeloyl-ACP methyl ester carboxylesterase